MRIAKKYIRLNSSERLAELKIPVVGITGGIATGKSTISNFLKKKRLPLICADEIVKKIYKTNEAIEFLEMNYADCIDNGAIQFKKLREIFFNSSKDKEKIENFIFQRFNKFFLNEFQALHKPEFLFYDVPLLFEKKLQDKIDVIVTSFCSEEIQIKRLIARDSIPAEQAKKIIAQQVPLKDKCQQSHFVIDNNGTIEELEKNLSQFLSTIVEN